jgi:glycerophosphoryl diester phosphodiesterase
MSKLSFHPPVIGHRGVKGLAPENTMASFRRAKDEGVRWLETDVKLTKDGVPILMHDDTLDRTTNGHGPVLTTDWADIRKLDAGGWFAPEFVGERVPHLTEFLQFAREYGMRINVEIKPCLGRSQATAMVALIEIAKIWPRTAPPPLISSFDVDALITAAQLHPEWPRGFLFEEWPEDLRALMNMTEPSVLGIDHEILSDSRIAVLKKTGLPLLAYTVNNPARAQQLLGQGFVAVFSDNPKPILEIL